MRKTKIIATIGPVTNSPEMVERLFNAGVNAVRINFSHGGPADHRGTVETVKSVRDRMGLPIPLVLDTKGPEIRTRDLETEPVQLEKGNTLTLTTDDVVGNASRVAVTYKDFAKDLNVGSTVLIDDGLIELEVIDIKNNDVVCLIKNSGSLGSKKGINLPNVSINLPALTEKDIEDIKFGIEIGFDYVAASFVRSANDVLSIRRVLEENGGKDMKIISKIENREGVDNIEAILEVTDGIMVARGDLGVEIPFEEVPIIQKQLIKKCKAKGKLVVTATQMLESMVNNPRPTRAEASDVANAVYDGTDAIMLSGETAKGSFPVEAVEAMVRISNQIENSIDYVEKFHRVKTETGVQKNTTDAVSYAASAMANDLDAKWIVAITKTGYTVREVSKYRPNTAIVALTPDLKAQRQLNLNWGCYPELVTEDQLSGDDWTFAGTIKVLKDRDVVAKGDTLVIVGGTPLGQVGATNTLKVQTV